MAEEIQIWVDSREEASDLLRALAVRGLAGVLGRGEPGASVVLDHPYETTASLLRDLLPALEEWRLDRSRRVLTIAVGGRRFSLSGDAELMHLVRETTAQLVPAAGCGDPQRDPTRTGVKAA